MFEASCKAAAVAYPQNSAVVALVGGTPEEMMQWAKANLDLSVVSCFIPAANPAYAVRGETFSGAVIFNEETYKIEDLVSSLKRSLTTAATLADCTVASLIHCAYAPGRQLVYSESIPPTFELQASFGVSQAEIDDAPAFNVAEIELSAVGLSQYIKEEDGSIYFRYDTDDNTVKENESKYFDISEDLRSVGYQIEDPQIEHDCISGTLIPLETEQ